jgi:predicted dehydrogenase
MKAFNRRQFLASTIKLGATAGILWRVPGSSLLAAAATSSGPLQIAQIGCGRMGRGDMNGVMAHEMARMVAVCDLDSRRLGLAREAAEKFYTKRGEAVVAVKTYADYRQVLASPAIDAVIVSLPDHWHAQVAIAAALAGKHIYVQKPVTYNIAESIALRTAVKAGKVILQTGSQQRSERPFPAFRPASEAVRNGRIGQVKTVKIGVGSDKPSGKAPVPMPIPPNLDYERWLGGAPEQPYMEERVHPQNSVDGRPGWITTEDFGLGMITNWGAHHIDIAQWGMGMELSGPTVIEATADFMKNDVWTVHRGYHVEMTYPNGVRMILDNKFENGIHFEGTEGWVFCKRGSGQVTASDPTSPEASRGKEALRASNAKILSPLPPGATRWQASPDHYLNWLESIVVRREPIAPIAQSARSLQACAAAWIGMKLQRKLVWDPVKETFPGDAEANALCSRKARKAEFDYRENLKKAGLA